MDVLAGMNLDNGIESSSDFRAQSKGTEAMNHRQKLLINGTQQWVSYGSVQELVDKVTAEAYAAQRRTVILFRDYMLDWYHKYKEPKVGHNYRNNCVCQMKNHIFPFIGDIPLSAITVHDVQRIMDTLQSFSTTKQVKSLINMVMDAAIADELYKHPNPTHDKRLVMPGSRKKRPPLSKQHLSALIEALPSFPPEQKRLIALLIMTGARRGEALGARWEDINWENQTIHLQRVIRYHNNRPFVSNTMKTPSANRIVSLWEDFLPLLGTPQKSGFIVTGGENLLSERQYRNRWTALMKQFDALGLPHFTAHQLRHTYATIAANSGNIPPKVLQGMLGHANFQTTMNIYADIDADRVRQSSQALSQEYARIASKSCSKSAAV